MSSFHILSRHSNNHEFDLGLFPQCLERFNFECDAFYMSVPYNFQEKLKQVEHISTKNCIVICLKDFLEVTTHGYWIDRTPLPGSLMVQDLVDRNPTRQFIIFSTMENLQEEINGANVKVITSVCEGLDQRDLYRQMKSMSEKDMDSQYVYLNLNRNNRLHRVTALSYLFGRGFERFGLITCLIQGNKEDSQHPMVNSNVSDEIKSILVEGQNRLWETQFDRNYEIYEKYGQMDNFQNFRDNLRSKYKKVFVELISETTFSSKAYMLTEKTFHCMYGYCFPIILNSSGAVAHMREVGFDMFDDIVDHGYDQITDSVQRIITAIDSNKRLLTDPDYVKNLWRSNFDRFEHNAEIARIGAERFYVERFWNQIDDLVKSVSA